MMKVIEGDLIKLAKSGEFDVIIHGCNCFCTMGAGIARSIKNNFPEAYKADLATKKGDKNKLGTFSKACTIRDQEAFVVVNAYTQYYYGSRQQQADYQAIESVFKKIRERFTGFRIGYPMIGAGLAGGDWEVISEIIDRTLAKEDHTLVKFK